MWNEPSATLAKQLFNDDPASVPSPAEVDSVEPGSIGEDLGFEVGDKIISVNGKKPRDLIDYKFLISEEELSIEVIDQKGKVHEIYFV